MECGRGQVICLTISRNITPNLILSSCYTFEQTNISCQSFTVNGSGRACPSVHLLTSAFGPIVRYQRDHQYTWIPNGIEAIEGMLNPAFGEPTLYIDRRLAELKAPNAKNDPGRGIVPTLKAYQYLPVRDGHALSDLPKKDGYSDHCADALRYGVVNTLLDTGRRVGTQHIGIIHGLS